MNLIELIAEQESLAERISIIQAEKDAVSEKINAIVEPIIAQERQKQGKDTGTLSLLIEDGLVIKHVVPEIVSWNQGILKGLWEKIKASGDKPENYMDQKFNISETAYGKFPDGIKKAFDPAREVKPGKAKITFEDGIPF